MHAHFAPDSDLHMSPERLCELADQFQDDRTPGRFVVQKHRRRVE